MGGVVEAVGVVVSAEAGVEVRGPGGTEAEREADREAGEGGDAGDTLLSDGRVSETESLSDSLVVRHKRDVIFL